MSATCSVQPGILPPAPLFGGWFEALVDGLGFFRRDRDLLVLFSQLLLHERDRVIARRQALDLILSSLCRLQRRTGS